MRSTPDPASPTPADPTSTTPASTSPKSTAPAGTAYHRIAHLREPWARSWKPILTVFVAVIAYVVLASILLVAVVLVLSVLPGTDSDLGRSIGDPASPLDVSMALLMGALWIPAAMIGVRLGGWRPMVLLLSVSGRFRRDLLLGPAAAVLAASLLGTLAVTALVHVTSDAPAAPDVPIGQVVSAAVLALVLGVVKAVGAELALRGVLMQAFGTWLRNPVLVIGLAAIVSLLAASRTAPGVLIALVMGASCGYLAWRSGGLELPILLSASLTVSGGVVAAIGRALPGNAGSSGADALSVTPAPAATASLPGIAAATLPGAIGIGLLALVIAAVLGAWIGRREGLRVGEPMRRASDAPLPDLVAV